MKFAELQRNKQSGISWQHGLRTVAISLLVLAGCSGGSTKTLDTQNYSYQKVDPVTEKVLLSDAEIITTTTAPVTTIPITTTTSITTIPDIVSFQIAPETPEEIKKIICAPIYDWNCSEALAVAWCESSHITGAISRPNRNGTTDRGLFQVNDIWKTVFPSRWGAILDAQVNTSMAYKIWQEGNRSWKYWTCQPNV